MFGLRAGGRRADSAARVLLRTERDPPETREETPVHPRGSSVNANETINIQGLRG